MRIVRKGWGLLRAAVACAAVGRFNQWVLGVVEQRLLHRFRALRHGLDLNRGAQGSLHNFRRNVHRLEKALSYQVQKPVFGEDYIQETIQYLRDGRSTGGLDEQTVRWGESVLDVYFERCQSTVRVDEARRLYREVRSGTPSPGWAPYLESQRSAVAVAYDDLLQLAVRRRSVRLYRAEPPDRDLIRKAMAVAALSPSACNRQAFRFLYYDDAELVKQISAIPGGIAGYTLPAVVLVTGCYRGYFDARDFNTPLIDASLASMAFLLALETLGLSSVCANWPCLPDRDAQVRTLLGLADDMFVVLLIGVGHPLPEGLIPYSAKQPQEALLRFNERSVGPKVTPMSSALRSQVQQEDSVAQ